MAYCTARDVGDQFKRFSISPSTSPSEGDVGDYAAAISAEIDAVLVAAGIALPVTDASKLLVLNQLAINGVGAMLLRAVQGNLDEAAMRQKLFDDKLAQISKTPALIASSSGSGAAPAGSTGQTTRPFRRDDKDW